MVKPLFNPSNDEWVVMVGRYILNMGTLEAATRLIITHITGSGTDPILSSPLASRIEFIRKRFPRNDRIRHAWAMNAIGVAEKHAGFRNIVAHSPLLFSKQPDGTVGVHGIMNVTPASKSIAFELISLEELKGRVTESAAVARDFLEMPVDFQSARPDTPNNQTRGVDS